VQQRGELDPEQRDRGRGRGLRPQWQPIGRQGYREEIAAAAVYLASDESAFMTESAFVIDGAMTAR
jgi:2-keto-3-deoxy-L-fuconate dehydrogenase